MFDKSDKTLLTFRVLAIVFIIVALLGGFAGGFILCMNEQSLVTGILILAITPFLCWFMWLANRLIVTFMCDIKLIRNKLYGVDNDNLSSIFAAIEYSDDDDDAEEYGEEDYETSEEKKANKTTYEKDFDDVGTEFAQEKKSLKRLFEQNIITEKEYQQLLNELKRKS